MDNSQNAGMLRAKPRVPGGLVLRRAFALGRFLASRRVGPSFALVFLFFLPCFPLCHLFAGFQTGLQHLRAGGAVCVVRGTDPNNTVPAISSVIKRHKLYI